MKLPSRVVLVPIKCGRTYDGVPTPASAFCTPGAKGNTGYPTLTPAAAGAAR